MKNPEVTRLAPAPVAADVGIVMALPIEAGYLCDRLQRVRKFKARLHSIVEGEHAGKIVALVICGAGKTAARRGAEVLIAGHRPRWLISAGFAGGLDPELARNDLVLPDSVLDLEGQLVQIPRRFEGLRGVQRTNARLLTVNRVISQAADKAELRREHPSDLIDMETSAVALLARERSLPFISVRIISDDALTELPPEVTRLLAHSGSYRVGVAVRAIWNRPAALKDFLRLHARALEASDRLGSCLLRLLESLPAP